MIAKMTNKPQPTNERFVSTETPRSESDSPIRIHVTRELRRWASQFRTDHGQSRAVASCSIVAGLSSGRSEDSFTCAPHAGGRLRRAILEAAGRPCTGDYRQVARVEVALMFRMLAN